MSLKGKKQTEEHIRKRLEARILHNNLKQTEEAKRKIREGHLGIKRPIEERLRRSEMIKEQYKSGKRTSYFKGKEAWNKDKHIQTNTGKTHFKKGQKSWNTGLTKENDKRLAKLSKKLLNKKKSKESIEKSRLSIKTNT